MTCDSCMSCFASGPWELWVSLVLLECKVEYLHVFFPLHAAFCYSQCQDIIHVRHEALLGYVRLHWPDLYISACIIKSVIEEKEKIGHVLFWRLQGGLWDASQTRLLSHLGSHVASLSYKSCSYTSVNLDLIRYNNRRTCRSVLCPRLPTPLRASPELEVGQQLLYCRCLQGVQVIHSRSTLGSVPP